jgi:nitroreductase
LGIKPVSEQLEYVSGNKHRSLQSQFKIMFAAEFDAIVNKRRSNRSYDPAVEVPDTVITKGLEQAILSPNSSNMQLWEFHWIKDPALKEHFHAICLNQSAAKTSKHLVAFVTRADLWKKHADWNLNNVRADIGDREPTKREKRGLQYYSFIMPIAYRNDALGISTLIRKIVCFVMGFKNPFMRIGGSRDQRVVVHKSCALAAQTFMLSMTAQGYDTCPMEGFDSLRARKALNLPSGAEVGMIISVGKGTEAGIHGPRRRIPFEEVVIVH